jgi:uncharacterized protein (TIGR00266 family)
MQTQVLYRPSYSLAVVTLAGNELIQVEAGSMVSMSPDITIQTNMAGGLMGALKRSILGGESFFMNTFQAPPNGGQMTLAPSLPGDLMVQEMASGPLLVQSGSYVASAQTVQVDTQWTGARTFFASEGLFMLKCSGSGSLILSSYGAIHEMQLQPGQRYTIDTGHLVAFSLDMDFRVRTIAGIKSTLFSGEGLVVDLTGPGRVLMQTRSSDAFLTWLMPQVTRRLPANRK